MTRRTLAWACLAAITMWGCGGSDGGLDSAGDRILGSQCDQLFRCAGDSWYDGYDRAVLTSASVCRSAETADDLVREVQPYIDAGTVLFDAGALRQCANEVGRTCSETGPQRRACNSVFTGTLQTGQACESDIECVSGDCEGNFLTCGACAERGAIGSPCATDFQCRSTLAAPAYCEATSATCVAGVSPDEVTTDATAGQACGRRGQSCAAGLYCNDGTCSAWRQVGEACNTDDDACEPGSVCAESASDPDRDECVPVVRVGPGEPCTDIDDEDPVGELIVCDISEGLTCRSGVCALRNGEEDAFCDYTAECADGLQCLSGYCSGDPRPDGAACRTSIQCASGSCNGGGAFPRTCGPREVCE